MCLTTQGHRRNCLHTVGGIKKAYVTNLDWIDSFTEDPDESFTDVTMVGFTVTNISAAASAVFTAAGHDFQVGDLFFLNGTTTMEDADGTLISGRQYTITAVTSTTFTVGDLDTTGSPAFGASALTADRGWFEIQFDKNTSSGSGDFTVSNGNRFYTQNVNVLITPANNETRKLVRQLGLGYTVWAIEDNKGQTLIFFDENGGQTSANPFTTGVAAGDYAGFTVTITGEEDDPFRVYDPSTNALPVFAFTA